MSSDRADRLSRVFTCLLVVSFFIFTAVSSSSAQQSSNNSVNWLAGTPTIQEESPVDTWKNPDNHDCTQTKLPVMRNMLVKTEEYCVVQTAAGLMDTEAQVLQPNGQAVAYPIERRTPGGSPYFRVIPNQAGVLYIKPSDGMGSNIGYYKNFYSHLKFDYHYGSPRYYVDAVPTDWFRKPDNSLMQFNPYGTLAFSQNGRYFVIDSLFNGFAKIDILNYNVQYIADTLPRTNGKGLLQANVAIDNGGKWVAISYNAPGSWGEKYFKLIDTEACTSQTQQGFYTVLNYTCATRNALNETQNKIPGLRNITKVRFVNERTIMFTVSTQTSGDITYTQYSMTAAGQKRSLLQYLAMGDSYISGEGAYNYRLGTDTERNMCHQSLVSYPYLLSSSFESFADVACSGAEILNIVGNENDPAHTAQLTEDGKRVGPTFTEENTAKLTYLPGYAAQSIFVRSDNPEVITLSVGGNDFGFVDIIQLCANPTKEFWQQVTSASTCYDSYEERYGAIWEINEHFLELKNLYSNLRDTENTNRRLYVIGYPQIAKVDGDCGLNVHLNADEIRFGSDLISYMNSVIKKAADEAGAYYVDIEDAFVGNRLCEGPGNKSAVNGFTISRTEGPLNIKASYHPNKRGHEMLAAMIAEKTHNLTAQMPEKPVQQTNTLPVDADLPILQGYPQTSVFDRYVNSVFGAVSDVMQVGDTLSAEIPEDAQLKPGAQFVVELHSTPANLGTFTADTTGKLAIHSAIPANTPPGFHTLHIYGPDMFGNQLDMHQTFYVAANMNDYDGDSVPNDKDSCAIAIESGHDVDEDGIDDVCDPLIDEPPLKVSAPTLHEATNIAVATNSTEGAIKQSFVTTLQPQNNSRNAKVLASSISDSQMPLGVAVPSLESDSKPLEGNASFVTMGIVGFVVVNMSLVFILIRRREHSTSG